MRELGGISLCALAVGRHWDHGIAALQKTKVKQKEATHFQA